MSTDNSPNKKTILVATFAMFIIAAGIYAASRKHGHVQPAVAEKPAAAKPAARPAAKPPVAQKAARVSLPHISHVTLKSSTQGVMPGARLPFSKLAANNEKLDFNFILTYKKGDSTFFHVTPDDCVEELTVEGKEVKPTQDIKARRCSWRLGFVIDLKDYLHEGDNKIYVQVSNRGRSPAGLRFDPLAPQAAHGLIRHLNSPDVVAHAR